mmetsp:Transcript_31187/g.72555  ORF Transcript_31187/g.72555 Transcript_31187/m.72555 type:complete len:322 (-) Transcript_31187:68-1033(-)
MKEMGGVASRVARADNLVGQEESARKVESRIRFGPVEHLRQMAMQVPDVELLLRPTSRGANHMLAVSSETRVRPRRSIHHILQLSPRGAASLKHALELQCSDHAVGAVEYHHLPIARDAKRLDRRPCADLHNCELGAAARLQQAHDALRRADQHALALAIETDGGARIWFAAGILLIGLERADESNPALWLKVLQVDRRARGARSVHAREAHLTAAWVHFRVHNLDAAQVDSHARYAREHLPQDELRISRGGKQPARATRPRDRANPRGVQVERTSHAVRFKVPHDDPPVDTTASKQVSPPVERADEHSGFDLHLVLDHLR